MCNDTIPSWNLVIDSKREGRKHMKKVIFIVVGSFLLIALVYVIGMPINKSVFGQVKINEERKVKADCIDSLNIQTSSANVEIGSDTTKQIKVKLEGSINKKLKDQYQVEFRGDSGNSDIKLQDIMYKDKNKYLAIGMIGKGTNQLKVKTTSGDFTVQ